MVASSPGASHSSTTARVPRPPHVRPYRDVRREGREMTATTTTTMTTKSRTPVPPAAAQSRERQRDPERTRAEILEVATREFAQHGYAGARVDEIAARTRTTKRMIYYYFGSKEQLYVAVLERAYQMIRSVEQELDVEHLDPVDAIRQLAELTFDHHESHPDFIRLVSIENIHRAEHLRKSPMLSGLADPAVAVLGRILERGRETG